MTGRKPAALVLAAGRGSRFGGAKMLADVNGRPMLQRVLDLAAAAHLAPVVVVLGHDADTVEAAVVWRNELRVRNPEPDRGLSSSLGVGLRAIGEGERVVVLLGDQPFLHRDQVDRIIAAERDPTRPIVVPRYEDGQPGNPVLLERAAALPLVSDLVGDQGMVQVIRSQPRLVRFVDVPGTNPDIDTPAELARAAGGPSRIRRQINELEPSDLEQHPIWEFALDEVGEPGQDEATVRPVVDRSVAADGDVVRATFVAADGIRFVGYVTPDTWSAPGWLQPTIVTNRGQVNFWLGWREAGVRPDDLTIAYGLLETSPDRVFPITYELDAPWAPSADKQALAQRKRVGASDHEFFPNSAWMARSPNGRAVGTITGFMWLSEPGADHHEVR